MRVYHFLNSEYGLAAIDDRQIKVSRINLLNDPFEYLQFESDNYAVRLIQKHRKTEANKYYGVICFTQQFSNPVLWAHYADKHRGLCLGFDVPDSQLLPIEYVDKRHPASSFTKALDQTDDDFLKFMLTKKHKHWSYEQEFRTIHRFGSKMKHDQLCFAQFGSDLQLSEVVLGYRTTITKAILTRALRNGGLSVPVTRVAPSATRFEMLKPSP